MLKTKKTGKKRAARTRIVPNVRQLGGRYPEPAEFRSEFDRFFAAAMLPYFQSVMGHDRKATLGDALLLIPISTFTPKQGEPLQPLDEATASKAKAAITCCLCDLIDFWGPSQRLDTLVASWRNQAA